MFLANDMPTLFLFYLGATQSFMSLPLSKKFYVTLETLDFPLEIDIVEYRTMSVSSIHRDCVLEIFWF